MIITLPLQFLHEEVHVLKKHQLRLRKCYHSMLSIHSIFQSALLSTFSLNQSGNLHQEVVLVQMLGDEKFTPV